MSEKIKCLQCGEVIQSMHVHDFKFCECGNVFIDGGDEYLRYGVEYLNTIEIIKEEK